MKPEIEQVTAELMTPETGRPLPVEQVAGWMASADLETMGAVFSLLHNPEHHKRISPPLVFDDYRMFHLRYYERCMRENLEEGIGCDLRYTAAYSLVGWFIGLWKDESVQREVFRELKALLARLYRGDDEALKVAVVTGALEHLLTDRSIRRFFADWERDDGLRAAYLEALNSAGNEQD